MTKKELEAEVTRLGGELGEARREADRLRAAAMSHVCPEVTVASAFQAVRDVIRRSPWGTTSMARHP